MAEWHDWYVHRGLALSAIGRHDEAIADYTTALTLRPRLVSALVARGDAYLAEGESANAVADFHRAMSLDRDFAANYPSVADKLARLAGP